MHNKSLRSSSAVFVLFFVCVHMVFSQNGTEADNLAATERLFSSYTVDNGIKDGFVKYFDEHSVIFRPFAVNGHDWYVNHKPIKGILSWYPTYVLVSASKELGISTGPWEYRDSSTADQPSGYGHFFSMWKKNSQGEWKVMMDIGNSYKKEERKKERKNFILSSGHVKKTGGPGVDAIRNIEKSFAMTVQKDGLKTGMEKMGSKYLRVYRGENFPGLNKKESLSLIAHHDDKYIFQPSSSFVAESEDLAYTYGIAVSPTNDTSNFVHVWQNDDGWKLLVDIMELVKK